MEILKNNVESINPEENTQTAVGEDALSDLIDRATNDQGASRPLMTPKENGPGAKKGRPRKNPADPKWSGSAQPQPEPTPPPGPPPFDATGACREFFKVASKVLVAKTGVQDCALLPEEQDGLSVAWGAVANQYIPLVLAQYGPLILACSVTASVVMRLNVVAQNEIDRRKAAQAQEVKNESAAQYAEGNGK